ncbi:peptidase [Litorimonas cladophorae]|uniref:Peptidase n=1 Tax=Litorimonas cladophorae TaxID=1220491 RepID=A0A918NHW2_9PROT|nr:prolyl oligopeptidase family serine peptidase [Litorimonas cladophorae]GGX68685.1 peptidase [Litorimonas cladophorae]
MTFTRFSKAALFWSASAFLMACADSNTSKPSTETAELAQTGSYKMISYDTAGETDADHLWLEEVESEKALNQVKTWNKRSLDTLKADPRYATFYADALEILQSKDKIPYVSYRNNEVHNFWQDETHVRGIWRKSTLDSYLSDAPVWETVLDIDKLAKDEEKNWVYKGNTCLAPTYEHCMVNLSDGGKDAVVRREFNTKTKTFVEDGFITPESKGTMDWVDENTVVIGVDFGDGTMTDSGYPMLSKIWKRGTPLSSAVEIGRGEKTDVGYWGGTFELSDGRREIVVSRSVDFYNSEVFHFPRNADGSVATKRKFPIPMKSNLGSEFKGQVLLSLNEDWREFKSGDLVSFAFDDFAENGEIETVNLVYRPDAKSSMNGYGTTKSKLLMSISTDVKSAAYAFDWDGKAWTSKKLDFPANGTVAIGATNDKEDVAFVSTESFLTPDTLWTYNTATEKKAKAKSLPDWFDASNMVSEQFFATSKDGTKVPYFVVRAKDTQMDGTNPTLLYGYGGFEISLNPSYSATRGKLWLENGGVYVLANIRGGGEYGPSWHQSGLKTDRQRIYDDFIAVAESLIAKKITSPAHLGVEGGSNGGLLTGVMTTQRPDLFNAAIIAVPLLDMQRFHVLLAGASWMGEYGNPEDAVEGKFLRQISPYHNLDPNGDYPEVFLITSTKDDRVHPAHARKFAKRMEDQGHDFFYYENIDGGHSAAANLKETANRLALQHVYLMQKLKDGK